MDTLAQIYARHSGGDKFNDRGTVHSYIDVYEELLYKYRHHTADTAVIEIGLYDGHGFKMWQEYFRDGVVFGVDISETPLDKVCLTPLINSNRLSVFIFDAAEEAAVERCFPVATYRNFFRVIIEDAAHTLDQQLKIYSLWKERLAPSGLYVIEDIQNVDQDRHHFEALGFKILDRRHVKGRYDDVLAIYRKDA